MRKMSKHGIFIEKEEIINDKYKVLEHIATGGMSEVYLVEEVDYSGRTWAMKVANTTDKLSQKLVDETKLLSELDHPNLPQIVDFFAADDFFYLVMEYAEGTVLSDYFEANEKKLPFDLLMDVGIQLCDCLAYLHDLAEPIIYRDIKPGNIILQDDGTIMLIDFGIARKFRENKLKDTARIGTVGFAAPEQFEQKQTDSRTDLFSLGALLFYLLSGGKYIYITGKDKRIVMKKVPKSLKKCIRKLVSLGPDDRLQNARDARRLLMQAKEQRKKSWSSKKILIFSSLTLSMLIGLTIGVFYLFTR